jgi:hypothetical protein
MRNDLVLTDWQSSGIWLKLTRYPGVSLVYFNSHTLRKTRKYNNQLPLTPSHQALAITPPASINIERKG